ncbi:MAG: T9SS type A sorting domain-containing protein [Chitinophagaceae bacterium]|nr:T9SS type A sorting domain-containing protein [Chitinophagaceae bacterium]
MKLTAAAIISCCLLVNQAAHAEAKPYSNFTLSSGDEEDPKEKKPAKKTKEKAARFVSLNNDAVKIYPDIIKREMHVVAKDNKGKEITFFVFDVQGTLVQQYQMKAKDHYRVSGLKKGTYIYRVFSGDEETATGKFDIR